jgi:acetyl esterase/lipase
MRHPAAWLRAACALAVLAAPACRDGQGLLRPAPGRVPPPFEVVCVRDVAYYDGLDADDTRHRLDLFLPQGHSGYPVVLLVHGGAWMVGDKSCYGLYSAVGEFLASQGVGAVLANYRLSPWVKHPEHVRDVARAFAWTKCNVGRYGGRPDQVFLAGHSAGGHLVSLLATDETYLAAEGLRTADVRGVISVCGVYRIPEGNMVVTLGGSSPLAFRFEEVLPLHGGDGKGLPPGPGLPLSVNVFGPAFGDDPAVRVQASPRFHVRPGLPPFLLVSSQKDLPTLPAQADQFCRALHEHGNEAWWLRVPDRNHNSVMFRATAPEDPLARAILQFVRMRTAGP